MKPKKRVVKKKTVAAPVPAAETEARFQLLAELAAGDAEGRDVLAAMATVALVFASQEARKQAQEVARRPDGLEALMALAELVALEQERQRDGQEALVARNEDEQKARLAEGLGVLEAVTIAVMTCERAGRGKTARAVALARATATVVQKLWGQEKWASHTRALKAMAVGLVAMAVATVGRFAFPMEGPWLVVGIVGPLVALAALVVAVVALGTERSTRAGALARANCALRFVELLVPKRIADEEIGDAAEYIARMIEQARPNWQIYLKVISTAFWMLLNAFRATGRATARKALKKGSKG